MVDISIAIYQEGYIFNDSLQQDNINFCYNGVLIMYNDSLQQNDINVKQDRASVFSLVEKDRATQECDLSVSISPPTGESALAFTMYDKLSQGLIDTSWGGSKALNSSDKLCEARPYFGELFDPYYYKGMSCSLDSYCPNEDFSIRLDTCKQVGILKSKPVRDESLDWSQKFDELRDQREKLADVLSEAGRYKEARNVRNCGESFLAYKANCCGDTLARPMSCGHRLCPVCMVRRSAKLAVKVEKFIIKMKRPKHIVLTDKNVSKIDKAYFSKLRRCFVKLRHRDVFKKCAGGFYSIETTYNSVLKSWHVHIHVVADMTYVPKQELVDEWNDITEGSFIVDIHEIGSSGQSPQKASRELAKYVVKPGDFLQDSSLVDEYLKAVKGS
ncbi:MAG: hypothetical protein QG646_1704, partial [Euryarchaeota archaeon]|nr:hypothetical protein [Euryarchaeota archaeon]